MLWLFGISRKRIRGEALVRRVKKVGMGKGG